MGKKLLSVLTGLVISMFALNACGGNAVSWAYIHDPETEIISLSDNGKAVYKGSNYKYTKDDFFITLKDRDGNEDKLRYVPGDDPEKTMILYEKTGYNYQGEGHPDSVIGVWVDDNNRSSFQFTDKGTFSEDNIFYGHYTFDEDASTIKLMYDEPLEDTILYYELDGDRLTVEYPWPMVITGSGDGTVDSGTIKNGS